MWLASSDLPTTDINITYQINICRRWKFEKHFFFPRKIIWMITVSARELSWDLKDLIFIHYHYSILASPTLRTKLNVIDVLNKAYISFLYYYDHLDKRLLSSSLTHIYTIRINRLFFFS